MNLADLGVIRDGFDPRLDELRDISKNSKTYLAQIEQRERSREFNIGSLKVRFNNVFGYYIEISKANLHLSPADYERKQTLVNAERFTTPELKELEVKILEAEEKMLLIEREIFEALRALSASHATRIKKTAAGIAELDVTVALAETAAENRYTRPRFDGDGEMRVVAGRHPVIESTAKRRAAVYPQRSLFPPGERVHRGDHQAQHGQQVDHHARQVALLCILSQMGDRWCAAPAAPAGGGGPGVHAGRGGGQPGAGRVDLHGRGRETATILQAPRGARCWTDRAGDLDL